MHNPNPGSYTQPKQNLNIAAAKLLGNTQGLGFNVNHSDGKPGLAPNLQIMKGKQIGLNQMALNQNNNGSNHKVGSTMIMNPTNINGNLQLKN